MKKFKERIKNGFCRFKEWRKKNAREPKELSPGCAKAVKICNLLYLLTAGQPAGAGLEVETTQGELAELLGLSRVQFTRGLSELRSRKTVSTSRGRIQVTDLAALAEFCTSEVL